MYVVFLIYWTRFAGCVTALVVIQCDIGLVRISNVASINQLSCAVLLRCSIITTRVALLVSKYRVIRLLIDLWSDNENKCSNR